MAYRFYIDGTLVDSPMTELQQVTKISRDDNIGGIVITQEGVLQWNKNNDPIITQSSGYDILKAAFDSAVCSEALIECFRVENDITSLNYKGVIKVPQLEFSEQDLIISARIQDNSYYSYINNNRDLKVDFRATYTKNSVAIDPLQFWTVDMFNGCDGAFGGVSTGAYFKGYRVTDVFAFIVAAISDNKVGFQSDFLDNLTYPLFIFKGLSLRNSFTLFPGAEEPVFEVSFEKLFREVTAIYDLAWYIDATDPDNPIMRMETYQDTFGITSGVTIDEPLHIKTTTDLNTLYGRITTGSLTLVDGTNCSDGGFYSMNEAISYFGFKEESFFPRGQCNRNIEYRTVNEWIISNNVILDILIGGSTGYDDDYVLVECDGLNDILFTANAFPWPFFGQPTPPFFYNLGLNNMAKLERHSSHFETTFGNFLGVGTLGFRALLGDDPTQDIAYSNSGFSPNYTPPPPGLTVLAPFVNETTNGGYDGGGNYNNVAFEYTVPVGGDGDYSFHERLHFELADADGINTYTVQVIITHYDSGLVIKTGSLATTNIINNGFHFADGTLVTNAVAGDIIKFTYNIAYNFQAGTPQVVSTLTLIWDSFVECNGSPEGGVSVTSGNAQVRNLFHDIECSFSDTEFALIVANPTSMIPFTKDQVTRYGWIKELSRNDQSGLTQLKLMSSNATS